MRQFCDNQFARQKRGGKKMATIWKRGKLEWQVRIRRKGWSEANKTFGSKADAEIWARQIESEMDRGIFVSRTEAEQTTLKEALERYKLEFIPHLSHPEVVISRVNHLQKRKLASRFLATIRSKDIAEFIEERKYEGVAQNTIRLDLATLSKLFEIAIRNWGMESLVNPVKRVNKPKLPNGRTRRLDNDEESRLLEACSPEFQRLILFALETTMRREEISTLTWNNVNLEQRSIYLPKTKNGESRTIPLSPVAIELLRDINQNSNSDLVFCMSSQSITQKMTKATQKSKIVDFHFHDLRHEAISRFFERTDLDVMEIKSISGHRTLQMLSRYTHLRTARLADRLTGAKRGTNVHFGQ
jgi:integrase